MGSCDEAFAAPTIRASGSAGDSADDGGCWSKLGMITITESPGRANVHFGAESAVHWTPAGDLHEPVALDGAQWSLQHNVAFNAIDEPFRFVELGTVLRVDTGMAGIDNHAFQWPLFAFGVHPDRHRRTGSQRGEQ